MEVVLDAPRNFDQPLTQARLFGWHAALFPTGYSGRVRITVAAWRLDASGPMEVVSGQNQAGEGREKVHFTAPPASTLSAQTDTFLKWFEAAPMGDALIKARLAHLWLVTLHLFDDGNVRASRGRIGQGVFCIALKFSPTPRSWPWFRWRASRSRRALC